MLTKNLFSLDGRVALITGGSQGLGKMIAKGFLAQGAKVYISGRKAEVCERTALELSQTGGRCIAIPMDIATVTAARSLAAAVTAHEPSIDILVNNAGAAWNSPFDEFSEEGWDKVSNLNSKIPFFLTQAMAPALRRAAKTGGPSKVINIASIDGISLTHRETYSYAASKAGLIQLTRLMAARLIKDNICVSAIAPGEFKSRMNIDARDNEEYVSKHVPAGRIGTEEDIAGAAIFLASRAGDYVVGSTLTIDGGAAFAAYSKRGHG